MSPPARLAPPPAGVAEVFQALADPARLRVVELLSAAPRRAGELAEEVRVSAPTMSRHLRLLLRARLVTDERPAEDARVRIFRLHPGSVDTLRVWLDALQAHWDEQLASFQRHVEEGAAR